MQELLLSAAMVYGCGLEGSASTSPLQHTAKMFALHIDYDEKEYAFRSTAPGVEFESKSETEVVIQFKAMHNLSRTTPFFMQSGLIKWNVCPSSTHVLEPLLEFNQFNLGFTNRVHEDVSITKTQGKLGLQYSFCDHGALVPSVQIGVTRDIRHNYTYKFANDYIGHKIPNEFGVEAGLSLTLLHGDDYAAEVGAKYEYGFDNHRRTLQTFISLQRRF